MPINLSPSDSEFTKNCSDFPEYPIHKNLRTCTRQTPCGKQSCLTCSFPADSNSIPCTKQNPCTKQTCSSPTDSNFIRNLTNALNTTTSKATIATKPAPPIDHWISDLTSEIQDAILWMIYQNWNFSMSTLPRNCCPNLTPWNWTAPTSSSPGLTPIKSSTPLLLFPIYILLLLDSSLPG